METVKKSRSRVRGKAILAIAALGLGGIQALPFLVPAGNAPAAAPLAGAGAVLSSLAEPRSLHAEPRAEDAAFSYGIRHTTPRVMIVGGADRVMETFVRAGYTLDTVEEASRQGYAAVPRFMLTTLPRDLHAIDSVAERKALFIKTMLPLILAVNEGIMRERRLVETAIRIIGKGDSLSLAQAQAVERIMRKYRTNDLAELIGRVDIIPPSLALAQAAEESGWGTSRFARQANALFGHTGPMNGNAVIASVDGTFAMRTFDRLVDAVQAYSDNLNTHLAYKEFRALRATYRKAGKSLDSAGLAGTLLRYSERGKGYVENIRAVIRTSRLTAFDAAKLHDGDGKTSGVIFVAQS